MKNTNNIMIKLFKIIFIGTCFSLTMLTHASESVTSSAAVENILTSPAPALQQSAASAQYATPLPNSSGIPALNQIAHSPSVKIGSGSHLFSVVLGLAAILGLIFILTWLVKRFSQGAFAVNSHIKIISALALGTRERILLIETGGQQLLIGVTATNIQTLHVLNAPVNLPDKIDNSSEFSKKLMSILQQKMMPGKNEANKDNFAS